MSKVLVVYFSAGGVTAKMAERLAKAIGADLHEIQPEVPYTDADLNWMDKNKTGRITRGHQSEMAGVFFVRRGALTACKKETMIFNYMILKNV